MTRRDRRRQLRRAHQHQTATKMLKQVALAEATVASKRSKKGERGIVAAMKRFGYTPITRVERTTKRVRDEHGNRRRVTTERVVERYIIDNYNRRAYNESVALLDAAMEGAR